MVGLDEEIVNYINDILDKYGIKGNRKEIFKTVYPIALESKYNPKIYDYKAYIKGTILNIITPLIEKAISNEIGE